jgi:Na+-driven multidrug efflux pump
MSYHTRLPTTRKEFCLFSLSLSPPKYHYIRDFKFSNLSEIVSRSIYMVKFLALCHLADAAQGFAGGIFRAIGAQRYCFIMVLLSFYLIGIPTGLYLMIKTKLRVLGNLFSTIAL